MDLPTPVVLESYLDTNWQPSLPAVRLRWNPDHYGSAERTWYLPRHLTLKGPAPTRFGVSVVRDGPDSYTVRLVWNDMSLAWTGLKRVQLLTSAVSPLLRVLGQDLWQLLNQPIRCATASAGASSNAA